MPSNIGICGCNITVSLIKKTVESNLMYRSVIIKGTRSFYTSLITSCQTSVNEANISDTSYQLVNERKINGPNLASEIKQKNLHTLKNEDLKSKILNASLDVLKWMFSETLVLPDKVIEKKFPSAKVCLHNVYTIVANETKILNPMTVSTKHVNQKKKMVWSSTYSVKWPEEKSFTSIASSKAVASESAALKCLYWLHLIKKVQNRLPIIYEKQEKLSMMKTPDELKIDENILATLNQFLDQHEHEIQNALTVVAKKSATHFQDSRLKLLKIHPVSFVSVENDMRNSILAERLRSRIKVSSPDLPIFRYKSEILRELEENQALVIKGDTGCGKTTQVPQFIIDNMTEKGIGSNCSMVVTQPRRISAISLAERVAFERYEHIGDVIGYQVRLQQVLPKQNGSILFCTTGILLKKIQNNPNLEGCSHVIVDEAHERSVDTDMLLVLLKRALKKNLKLRVIVMSATINADLFQKYLDCRAVEVPGRIFPVKTYLMDDMYELDIPFHKPLDIIEDHAEPNVNLDQITDLIRWIDNAKPPGAILCFLPGWSHIYRIQITLDRYESHRFEVIPLHSKIPYLNQSKIFQPTPQGKRKIILATDVAETGITVPDIVYVIDSACHKEVRWHKNKGLSSIDTHWISRANFNQRRGRAGRVREGESYHFITKQKFSDLDAYPLPEVLRVSLEKTVLDCKTYSSEKVEDFLGSMPQPPRQSYVKKAVQDLQILGALDENEDLTALGKRIALFTVHPKLSKALVYSSIFQCLSPVATVVAALSTQSEIFYDTLENKSHIRETKARFHPTSDHLAVSWIHAQWQNLFNQSRQNAYNFCRINRLHAERISILDKIREINLEHLYESNMISNVKEVTDLNSKENEFSFLDELVRGVLLAGMDQVLKHRNFEFRKGRLTKSGSSLVTEDDAKAQLTTECVNHKRKFWPSPYLTYFQKTHHEERRTTLIRESSMISPLTVLLFSQGKVIGRKYCVEQNDDKILLQISGKQNVQMVCDPKTAGAILRFRDVMWSIVQFYVENDVEEGILKDRDNFSKVVFHTYKQKMLKTLGNLLNSASAKIDSVDKAILLKNVGKIKD